MVRPLGGHRENGTERRFRGASLTWRLLLALAAPLTLLPAAPAAAQSPVPAAPRVIAGPSAQVASLGGLSLARDGTGAIVYLARVGGTDHVFVSRLTGGVFQAPVRVDASLPSASSQPVVAAGNNGLLLVGFVNAGNLYVTQAPTSTTGWQAPSLLHGSAHDPSIQMSSFGKAYLAFTAAAGGGSDVLVDYFAGGTWSPATAPFNVTPGDDGGTGAGVPVVATSGDGVGIVAWGEGGHVYARRVWATSPSVADERLDPSSFDGATELNADTPAISVGGNSSYVDIGFDEHLPSGGGTRTRVLMTRLISARQAAAVAVDGLSSGGSDSAGLPAVGMGEYESGWTLAVGQGTGHLVGSPLDGTGTPGAPEQIDTDGAVLSAAPATAIRSTLVAWEQSPVATGPQVMIRYGDQSTSLGTPTALSSPGAGPLQPDDGFATAADKVGDVGVAWVQGSPGAVSLDAAQLFQAPGAPNPLSRFAYVRHNQPQLNWKAASARWGPIRYTVTLDGTGVGSTSATSLPAPGPLTDGRHVWQVAAENPAGLETLGFKSTLFVDTTPPQLSFHLSGRPRTGRPLTLHITARDAPAGQPGAAASGRASVRVMWGDGSPRQSAADIKRARHIYTRRGSYRISVRVRDRAGNATTITRHVRIRK